ncbi:calcium-activated chloride channel-domain-containing protein [Tribonema minus]|uniref:Calcium-activated chloride channel-domain-containing protein n=1 Tax=Tribonema minus TaxID=303371 RepID=A0A836CNP9_9STRA|nr:calcium-activated chloride channel-domain-containing protein [Tribonema minus]
MSVELFAFQFVNFFCALFYIGFFLRDMPRLSGMLFSLCVTKQLSGNAFEVGLPLLRQKYAEYRAQKELKAAQAAAAAPSDAQRAIAPPPDTDDARGASGSSTAVATSAAAAPGQLGPIVLNDEVLSLADFEGQLVADQFVISDEYLELAIQLVIYLELAIQFGFSTMFAVAFPLAPLFAYVNNVAEYKIDLHALKQARRPTPVVASSIGTWITCLEAMGFFATFTNCCLMVFLGRSMDHFLPEEFHSALDRLEVRALLALGMEHILLAVKFILAGVVDDEPLWVKEALAKKELEERDTTKRLRLIAAGMKEPPPIVEDPKVVERNNAIAALRKVRKERNNAIAALRKFRSESEPWSLNPMCEPWSFNPMWYAALIALPYMVSAYGMDYMWAVPLAAMIVGYMQHEKDKAEVGLTTGEIHDSSIKALIARELPKWFSDSETERVEWLNKLLQHMWPHASGATDAMVREMVDPMLAEYKPAAIDKLGFRVISLGTIAPRVVGIRTFDSNESCVVLDMEMKWNGNPKIVIEVGRSPLPITITLSNIRFSGKVRAELSPLVPLVPCFGNLSVCFMERPYVDFTFKVGAVDLMSLGPAELNIASAVSAVTKMVLQDIVPVLYPQKMVIPIIEPKDLAGLAAPAPTGVLQLEVPKDLAGLAAPAPTGPKDLAGLAAPARTGVLQLEVVGADNLRKADLMGKSDPYVVIKLGEEENKTSVINSNLNPRWGEKFDILVHDKASQVVTFDVYDEDLADNDDHLGRCEVPLSALLDFKITALNVPLTSTPTGSLLLKLEYVPLQAAPGTEKEDLLDVLPPAAPGTEKGDLPNAAPGTEKEDLPDVVFDQSPEELTDELVASEEVPMLDETPDFDLANMGADSMGKLLPAKEQRKGSMFNKGLKMIPTKQLGGALKAVSAVVTLGALGGDDIPAEPMAFSDPSDRSMGVLTIQNISVSEVKAAKMYCIVQQGNSQRKTQNISVSKVKAAKMYCIVQQGNSQRKTQMSEKATEASWLMAVHMLIRGSKTAQVEIAVMQKGGLTASDAEVGRVKLRIEEIVSNDNALEREWPLLGEKAVGSMKFKAVWTPAAIPAQD